MKQVTIEVAKTGSGQPRPERLNKNAIIFMINDLYIELKAEGLMEFELPRNKGTDGLLLHDQVRERRLFCDAIL
eukprot:COSAG06_NODE_4050_length_4631_cov_2.710062_5_plen_74_part_00